MAVSITLDASDLDAAITLLGPLFDFDPAELMETLASKGESQTRRRIESEKTGPDGAAWPPNLEGTSILRRTGTNLLDQIGYRSNDGEAAWGSFWEHAHVHQFGMTISAKNAANLKFRIGDRYVSKGQVTIPARPFLGLSTENRTEMLEMITDVFGLGRL